MRNYFRHILFGLLSAFALDGFAQVGEYRSNLAFGVNAGATFNKVEFNPSVKQVMKQGSTFGLTLRYTCEKYIKAICAIQMEVNYAQLGWKEDIDPITLEGGATRIDKYEPVRSSECSFRKARRQTSTSARRDLPTSARRE